MFPFFRTLLAVLACGLAARGSEQPAWTTPFPAHRIAGNLYHVGSQDLASYLITTDDGHILINSSLQTSVPLIQRAVEELGFRFSDIRILLISHAHWDHCAGSAEVKRLTGAKYFVMAADVPDVEAGGRGNFFYANQPATFYPPTKVDRALKDGDEVTLGGVVLVARHTPGHTRGTTTWTLKVAEGGRQLDAVIIGSPNVNQGYQLVGNPAYPEIADDYARTFRVLKSLPCDLFLGAHGSYYDMVTKVARLKTSSVNPFIDPDGYRAYVENREQAFQAELARQQAAAENVKREDAKGPGGRIR